jgi:hypothetical protein
MTSPGEAAAGVERRLVLGHDVDGIGFPLVVIGAPPRRKEKTDPVGNLGERKTLNTLISTKNTAARWPAAGPYLGRSADRALDHRQLAIACAHSSQRGHHSAQQQP